MPVCCAVNGGDTGTGGSSSCGLSLSSYSAEASSSTRNEREREREMVEEENRMIIFETNRCRLVITIGRVGCDVK